MKQIDPELLVFKGLIAKAWHDDRDRFLVQELAARCPRYANELNDFFGGLVDRSIAELSDLTIEPKKIE